MRRGHTSFAPQIIFHLAAHPDAREDFNQARAAIETNFIGTLNALEAFRLCVGARRKPDSGLPASGRSKRN